MTARAWLPKPSFTSQLTNPVTRSMNLPRTLTVLLLQLACSGFAALAQVYEANAVGLYQFPFPAGAELAGQTEATGGIWQLVGEPGPGIKIGQGSLTVPGLAASSGNHARLAGVAGPGALIAFPEALSSGSIYYSLILQVPEPGNLGQPGATIAGLSDQVGPAGTVPGLGARLVIRAVEGGYILGVGKTAVDASFLVVTFGADYWHDFEIIRNHAGPTDVGLIVVCYTFKAGDNNDEVSLWLNPHSTAFGAEIPPVPDVTTTEGADWQAFKAFGLAQQASPPMATLTLLDEIRVGTTWASVTPPPPSLVGFSSGSDGSDGPIHITSDYVWDLDNDGQIQATTFTVAAGATLRLRRNANNTPVYILATGDVQIDGTIDVSGEPGNAVRGGFGGPGGFDGGQPGSVGVDPGGGHGPGGGRWTGGGFGGPGAHRTAPDANITTPGDGTPYGHALQRPPVGGSGGSGHPGAGGGGGGGAILIASDTRIGVGPQGAILSYGGNAVPEHKYNGGAGGSIVLVAPIVEGSGRLAVNGGTGYLGANPRGSAGAGWIRIDALDRRNLNLTYEGSPPSLGAAMLSLITPVITLRITDVAGTAVANPGGPQTIVLPMGADPNIAVKLQVENFKARVPVVLYATPDSGERKAYAATINNLGPGAAEATLNLTLPVNQRVTLEAFAGKGLPGTP